LGGDKVLGWGSDPPPVGAHFQVHCNVREYPRTRSINSALFDRRQRRCGLSLSALQQLQRKINSPQMRYLLTYFTYLACRWLLRRATAISASPYTGRGAKRASTESGVRQRSRRTPRTDSRTTASRFPHSRGRRLADETGGARRAGRRPPQFRTSSTSACPTGTH